MERAAFDELRVALAEAAGDGVPADPLLDPFAGGAGDEVEALLGEEGSRRTRELGR